MCSWALLATKNNSQVDPGFLNKAEHEEKTLCHFGVFKNKFIIFSFDICSQWCSLCREVFVHWLMLLLGTLCVCSSVLLRCGIGNCSVRSDKHAEDVGTEPYICGEIMIFPNKAVHRALLWAMFLESVIQFYFSSRVVKIRRFILKVSYVYVNKSLNPLKRNFYPALNVSKILNNYFSADLVWCL